MNLNNYELNISNEDKTIISSISDEIIIEIKIIIKQCIESNLDYINFELKNKYDINFIKKYNENIINNIKDIIIGIQARFLSYSKDYIKIQLNITKLKKEYLNILKMKKINDSEIKKLIIDNNLVSYIYLIQERENYMNNKNIYKFGKTTQEPDNKIKRLQSYKKGSRILMLIECSNENVNNIESEIREEFKKEFIKHIDGHEHFEGDPNKMKKIIYSKIMN
jgi:hypothetical protein